MKKRLSLLLVLVTMLALLLSACDIIGNTDDKDDGGSTGDNTGVIEGNVIFSPDVSVTVIKTSDEDVGGFAYNDLLSAIYACTNKFAVINVDTSSVDGSEIVVGDTARPISAKAKDKLAVAMDNEIRAREDKGEDTKYLAGYAVYAEGGQVAIVWNNQYAIELACDFFLENFVNASTLKLEDGYFCSRTFSLLERYRAEEDEVREQKYAAIEMAYGADVAQAIKNHLSMFGDTYYLWLADLYDPGLKDENGNWTGGGFYFSNSARDTAGFGIDLESTMQTISFLTNSGMSTGTAQTAATFPQDVLDQLAAFALRCQSSVDGYFYHPQWGTNIGVSRLGRDLGWATQILSFCGVKPYWNTPNNVNGLYGEPPGYENAIPGVDPAAPVTSPLSASTESRVAAVSKVVSTADGTRKWNGSEWLATLSAWENYILSFESTIRTKSYSNGNTFAAQSGQIKSRDTLAIENGELPDADGDGHADGGYIEKWEYYFNKWQLDYNGLWEHNKSVSGYDADGKAIIVDDPNGETYYNAINGLMKISSVYNSLGIKFNYADKAFACASYMSTYLGDGVDNWADVKGKSPTGSVDVYNPFVAMSQLISNINKFGKNSDATALREQLKADALRIVQTTTTKVSKFRKDDGSYGYNWGAVGTTSQGALVAVAGSMEGDVNGGNIAFTGVYNNMCSALGISAPKPFGYSDLLIFTDKISNQQAVIKDEAVLVTVEPVTFDDEPIDTTDPADVTLTMNGGAASVVEDPRDPVSGKVLEFTSNGNDGNYGATLKAIAGSVKNANCAILEWEMCFTEINYYSTVFQIKLGTGTTSYMITLNTTKDGKVTVNDSSSTTGSGIINTNFGVQLDAYSWNKFRVEFYLLGEDRAIAKIFVNNTLVALSSNHYNSHLGDPPAIKYDAVTFYALYSADFTCLFDNIYATQAVKGYVEEEVVDPNKVKNFDNVEAGSGKLPNGVATTGGTVVSAPTEENPENNIFVLDTSGENVSVSTTTPEPAANAASVKTKMKIDANSDGDIGKIYLAFSSKSNPLVAYNLATYTEDGTRYASLTEVDSAGKKGATFKGLPVGEWFELGIEFYPYHYLNSESSILYLGDEVLGYGSLFWSLNTVAKTYDKFIVELTAAATVSLDDVSPQKIAKLFVNGSGDTVEDPEVELPSGGVGSNTPAGVGHDGRFNFDDSALGVPKVEGLTTSPNTNEYGNSIVVATDPKDAANKVIKHNAVASSTAGNTSLFTPSKLSPSNANCFVFEFDILLSYFKSGGIQTSMKGTLNGKTVDMFQTNISLSGDWVNGSGNFAINSKYKETSSGSEVASSAIISSVPVSGWLNVRFELYPEEGKVQIYYDGTYRGETEYVYAYNMDAILSTCNIYTTYPANCEIYYDNIIAERIVKDYKTQIALPAGTKAGDGWNSGDSDESGDGSGNTDTPEIGGNVDLPEDYTGSFDFESEQTYTFNVPGLLSQTSGGYILVMEGDGATNKRALAFASVAGSTDALTVMPLALAQGKLANVFEFDIFVNSASEGVLYYVALGNSYVLTVSAAKDGTLAIGDIYSATASSARIHTLASGIAANAWNKIRVEYALVNGAAVAKVYLNGNLVAVSDNGARANANSSSFKNGFDTVTVTAAADAAVDALFDNITAKESDTFETAEYTHESIYLGKTYTYSPIDKVNGFEEGKLGWDTHTGLAASFTTDPADATNKVLHYSVKASDAATAVADNVTVTNAIDDKDADGNLLQRYGYLVFSFDVKWEGLEMSEKKLLQEYIFQAGSYWNHLRLYANANGTLSFEPCNTGLTDENGVKKPGVGSTYAKGIEINDGQWHNIMMLVERRGFDSTLSIFIDGVCVADHIASYYSTINADSNERMKNVIFRQKSLGDDYDVYIDNVIYEYVGEDVPLTRVK